MLILSPFLSGLKMILIRRFYFFIHVEVPNKTLVTDCTDCADWLFCSSRDAKLTVHVPPEPPVIINGNELRTTEDRETDIKCVSRGGKPAAEVRPHIHYSMCQGSWPS